MLKNLFKSLLSFRLKITNQELVIKFKGVEFIFTDTDLYIKTKKYLGLNSNPEELILDYAKELENKNYQINNKNKIIPLIKYRIKQKNVSSK